MTNSRKVEVRYIRREVSMEVQGVLPNDARLNNRSLKVKFPKAVKSGVCRVGSEGSESRIDNHQCWIRFFRWPRFSNDTLRVESADLMN